MIVGIDEVGRGSWAGPVVAAAVGLAQDIPGVKDSKLLSAKQRLKLAGQIKQQAVCYGIGWTTAREVDGVGLTIAVSLAMQRALAQIHSPFDEIIIDGNLNFLPDDSRATTLIKADMLIPSVSAASILAKVARDTWMQTEASQLYPEYMFERHVGYGTALHKKMLNLYGVSPIHRRSYRPIQLCSTRYVSSEIA